MSSRALRKLQGGAGAGLGEEGRDSEEEEMEQPARGGQAFNAFSLVSRREQLLCSEDIVWFTV